MSVEARRLVNRKLGFLTRPFSSTAADVLAVALGIFTSISVHLVGDIPIAELVLLLIAPMLLGVGGRRLARPQVRPVLILMGLWLAGEALADIYHKTAWYDWVRADSSIIFFSLDLIAFIVLLGKNERRKVLYIAGLALGTILKTRYLPDPVAIEFPWKFGYAEGVIILALLISCYFYAQRAYSISGLFIVSVIVTNLLLNFRSPLLQLIITIALVFPIIPERISRLTILPRAGSTMRVVVLAGLALGAGALADSLVHWVTDVGLLSEAARAKNESQEKGGGLLLGGRPEFLIGLRAALDSPLIGHGAWAKDFKYTEMMADMLAENNEDVNRVAIESLSGGLIPGHSELVTTWVWAGLPGVIFWLYILLLSLRGITRLSIARPWTAPLYTWILISGLWDILFSPYAYSRRLTTSLALVIIFDVLGETASKTLHPFRLRNRGWQRNPRRGFIPPSRWSAGPRICAVSETPRPID